MSWPVPGKRAGEGQQSGAPEEIGRQILLDSVPAYIFCKDTENRFVWVNEVFSEVMGLSKGQLEGKRMEEVYPKEQAAAYWRDDKEVFASGKPKVNIIEPVATKEGVRWLQVNKMPFRDKTGAIAGVIGFGIDITDLKRAEEDLIVSKKQIEAQVAERTSKLKGLYDSLAKQNKDVIRRQIELAEAKKDLEDKNYELNDTKNKLQEQSAHLEEQVRLRTNELNRNVEELEKFNRMAVGRELKMVELKKRVGELEAKLDRVQRQNGSGLSVVAGDD